MNSTIYCGECVSNFVCKDCNKDFNTKHRLISHQNSKKPCIERIGRERNWSCEKCTRTFTSKYGLKAHKELLIPCDVERRGRPFVSEFNCETCYKSFTTKQGLLLHKNKKYHCLRAVVNDFTCKDCNKDFKTKHRLISHKNKKYKCNIIYTTQFKCEICERSLSSKYALTMHKNKRNGCVSVSVVSDDAKLIKEKMYKLSCKYFAETEHQLNINNNSKNRELYLYHSQIMLMFTPNGV